MPIAVVGLGCRFPDAGDPDALFDAVLAGRRAFRRIPPCRVDLADYYSAIPATSDATYSTRAALIEGWRFDAATFGVPPAALLAGDPAQWLALETAARTLTGAGFPDGSGLPRDRTAVIIGNTLGGDVSRAAAMRLRWPYVRKVVAEAVHEEGLPAEQADRVLRHAAARYLAPFPKVSGLTQPFTSPAGFAAGIGAYFGFRGGSFAVDGGGASSLVAVATACAALAAGDIDVAIAGGVDVSLDPLELVGMAKAGVLATSDMRIYDEEPTGFLPGEGCGLVLLMRSTDVGAAGCRAHAHILGWGTAEAGQLSQLSQLTGDPASYLLAMQRAYRRAGADPADVALLEGAGCGIAAPDEAELTALARLRAGTATPAAIGSATASIGHCRAAAGAAGLIKTAMAVRDGVLPPAAGVRTPHPVAREADAGLRFPPGAEPWPDGIRLAGITAVGHDDLAVHLVLGGDHGNAIAGPGRKRGRPGKARRIAARSKPGSSLLLAGPDTSRTMLLRPRRARVRDEPAEIRPGAAAGGDPDRRIAYLLQAPDQAALTAVLSRIADIAPWLSDAELGDLACQLAWDAASQGPVRVAIVASRQEQLARLAAEAITVLPQLRDGLLTVRPGIFAAAGADGRVTLLLPDGPAQPAQEGRKQAGPGQTDALSSMLAALRWLDDLGVVARAAVGEGLGWLAGLAWAGCLTDQDVLGLLPARAAALRGKPGEVQARLRSAADRMSLHPPGWRLISASTATELTSAREIASMLAIGPAEPGTRASALKLGSVGASLLLDTGPGDDLAVAAAAVTRVPAVGLNTGLGADRDTARVVAALFAVGALTKPEALLAGQHSRPIDIWREQIFISSPCQAEPPADVITGQAEAAEREASGQPPQPPADKEATIEPPRPAADQEMAAEPPPGAASEDPAGEPPHGPADEEPASRPLQPAAADQPAHESSESPIAELTAADTERAAKPAAATEPPRTNENATAGMPVSAAASPATVSAVARPGAAGARAAADRADAEGTAPLLYAAELCEPPTPFPAPRHGPWRVHSSGGEPVSVQIRSMFRTKQNARRTIAVLGNGSYREDLRAAVRAISDAIATEQLVVISPARQLAGLWACLHAEYPAVGITVIHAPATISGLRAARAVAAVTPGTYRELALDADGTARELVLAPVQPGAGSSFPLGPADVVLISRDAGQAGLALAQVMACCGATAVIIGPGPDEQDRQFAAELARLGSAGVAVSRELADPGHAVALAAAVDRIEQQYGPVTAVAHGVGAAPRTPAADLTEAMVLIHQRSAPSILASLLGAVSPDRLKLVITFGSAAAKLGAAGYGPLALASAALAEQGRAVAAGLGCHAVHIDWPAWSPESAFEPDANPEPTDFAHAGLAPLTIADAAKLLLKVLAAERGTEHLLVLRKQVPAADPAAAAALAQAATLAQLATLGVPASASPQAGATPEVPAPEPATDAPPALPGRFCQQVLAHEPGTDLICETRLSADCDPYLTDYRVDGLPVFPVAMALEAMAEAASVLAGNPVRAMTGISVRAPVVVPAGLPGSGTAVRIRAQRDAGTVSVALRCEHSGFTVDHLRAVFSTSPGPAVAAATAVPAAQSAATRPPQAMRNASTSSVDGAELYGRVWFQAGRFRRISELASVSSRRCSVLASGADDQPWFGPGLRPAPGPVLGSPGITDAMLQAVQACHPNRLLLPVSCESAVFGGLPAGGVVRITAAEVGGASQHPAGPGAAGTQPAVPRQRPGGQPDDSETAAPLSDQAGHAAAWDVIAEDGAGRQLACLRGLRFRDSGPLPDSGPMPVRLLATYLERSARDLGLAADLEVSVRARPDRVPPQRSAGLPAGDAGSAPPAEELAGLRLQVKSAGPAACAWRSAASVAAAGSDPRLDAIAGVLAGLAEEPDTTAARAAAIGACWPGGPADSLELRGRPAATDGWVVLTAGAATMACVITPVAGLAEPVAIAIMTGRARPGSPGSQAKRGRNRGRQRAATTKPA